MNRLDTEQLRYLALNVMATKERLDEVISASMFTGQLNADCAAIVERAEKARWLAVKKLNKKRRELGLL